MIKRAKTKPNASVGLSRHDYANKHCCSMLHANCSTVFAKVFDVSCKLPSRGGLPSFRCKLWLYLYNYRTGIRASFSACAVSVLSPLVVTALLVAVPGLHLR